MTATWRDFSGGVVENGTAVDEYGSKTVPTKEVTITGDVSECDHLVPIPAGNVPVVLWAYSTIDPTIAFARAVIVGGSGFIDLYWKSDKPTNIATSPNDLTPLGTCVQWHHAGLSCNTDWKLNTQSIRVNPTLATAAGDSAGLPALAGSGATVEGRVYKIVAYNRGTSAVPIRFTKLD